MTKPTEKFFHILRDGVTLAAPTPATDPPRPAGVPISLNIVAMRGQSFRIDAAFVEATTDRDGFSPWADGVPDDETQIRVFGRVLVAPGLAEDDPAFADELEARRQAEEDRANQATLIELGRNGRLQEVVAELNRLRSADAVGRYVAVKQTSTEG